MPVKGLALRRRASLDETSQELVIIPARSSYGLRVNLDEVLQNLRYSAQLQVILTVDSSE